MENFAILNLALSPTLPLNVGIFIPEFELSDAIVMFRTSAQFLTSFLSPAFSKKSGGT